MFELSRLGPLRVVSSRQGHRVPIATVLAIGDYEIPAPENPHLLLTPTNVASLQKMWDALRMPSRNNLLVTGESGSGKTILVRYLGELYRQVLRAHALREERAASSSHLQERASSFQARVLTFHENLRRSDITERRHYGEAGQERTGWTMSDVLDGMVAGDWNVLSEVNRSSEEIWAEFNEPLENKAKSLHQTVIHGHPDTRFIATVNPVKSEGRGIYEGRVMSGEFVNRFTNKVHVAYLPLDEEFEVLKDYGPLVDDVLIGRLLALARDIRRDYAEEHGVVPFPVTTRALVRMVRHLQMFPADAAMLRTLFWRKMYWLDDQVHPAVARRLVENLLELHGIRDGERRLPERSTVRAGKGGALPHLVIGTVSHPLGPGGPFVPDTVIEEVPQNVADLEAILQDIALGEHIMLIGEAGVGKNKLESYLAHLLNWNLLVIGMSGGTRVSDLLTYRSFGEEAEGRTGDTATLGLRAFTDERQKWIVVLDEANKAKQGVLVSLNDLLQDRVVRLPGGQEAPVRATICVNINPNRPPYEVNDFSFEFMDRFSIHTIVHLPPQQAVEVLQAKYPGADRDFIQDVVHGCYALHPLYSGGVLFEPVTMRNEEAAIERGLQYPHQATNLIDLICAGYTPRDAREMKAIRNALSAGGFDRDVIAASSALARFRAGWEADRDNEGTAVALADTYRRLGKPTAALGVCQEMISRNPGRDWVYHLLRAGIFIEMGQQSDAEDALKSAFEENRVVRMDNGRDYLIYEADITIRNNIPAISLLAKDTGTTHAALILSGMGRTPTQVITRPNGEYYLIASDSVHDLCIYEQRGMPTSEQFSLEMPPEHAALSTLVRRWLLMTGAGRGFNHAICSLSSPPWDEPVFRNGSLSATLKSGQGTVCLTGSREGSWSACILEPGGTLPVAECAWNTSDRGCPGTLQVSLPEKGDWQVPHSRDPFVSLCAAEQGSSFTLALSGIPGEWEGETSGGLKWKVDSFSHVYQREGLPLVASLYPRLERIFCQARPLPGSYPLGAGDVVFSILPDSRVAVSVVADTNGIEPVVFDLGPGKGALPEFPREHDSTAAVFHLFIPFSRVDACEQLQNAALSDETQATLGEIRRYLASALFVRQGQRDIPFEARARATLLGFAPYAEPVTAGTTFLSRGDILVRTGLQEEGQRRSVFVVRFLHEGSNRAEGNTMVRGFWLAEENPVGEESLAVIAGRFERLRVNGDDRYSRIIRNLVGSCQRSVRPWQYSRTGTGQDLVEKFGLGGLSIEHHPMERRFMVTTCTDDGTPFLTVDESGYPVDVTHVNQGTQMAVSWTGTALNDVLFIPEEERVMVVLDDEFLAFLQKNRFLDDAPLTVGGGVSVHIIGRSRGEELSIAKERSPV
ncbi:MAG: AAA domain (dynein-related subfamily) [Methanoregulaceae archaeon PtaU1.Bin222]|nr:MAG: AAA domain (dynein-related subfamily) [Methanoregulaceae archaeon PtaU1.Bin222]